jgi:Arc/MetJ-type ribon-helix-helix transcriptional regulator
VAGVGALAFSQVLLANWLGWHGYGSGRRIKYVDVTLLPEIEKMVLDRVRSGQYSSTSELVNAAVRNLLEENGAAQAPTRPELKSLALAEDAPANLEWLRANRAAYLGEWVALHKGRLIAHGKNGLDVFNAAQSQGINPPLMHRIAQEGPVSWGGG